MKKLLCFVVLSGLLAVSATAEADHANNAGAHWGRDVVNFIDSVNAAWDSELDTASATWNAGLADVQTAVDPGRSGRRTRRRCPYVSNAARMCNFRYGNKGIWQGTAGLAEYSYQVPGGHITRARIRLNDTNTPSEYQQAVTTHEMGHILGLKHRDPADVTSCMTPSVLPTQVNPDRHDFDTVDGLHHGSHAATTAETAEATYEADEHLIVERSGDTVHVTWILPAS